MACRFEKSVTFLAVIIFLVNLSGCGYDPEKPTYDTKRNPKGFPEMACDLLERIESRRLANFESITNAFARLYGEYPSLLDNTEWHKVISRLGTRFQYLGDQEAGKGVEHYRRAAGYYDLAAFARPGDRRALERSRLFSAWQQAVVDSIIDAADPGALLFGETSVSDRIDFVKRFVFSDSLTREFARQYLVHELLGRPVYDETTADSVIRSLSMIDRAFLSWLGLADAPSGEPVAQFADSAVDLIAYQLVRLGEDDCRAEFYFVPRKRIAADYAIALRIETRDSARAEGTAGSGYLTADFSPSVATSRWSINQVTAAGRLFTFRDRVTEMGVGLYVKQGRQAGWASIAGSTDSMVTLPVGPNSEQ